MGVEEYRERWKKELQNPVGMEQFHHRDTARRSRNRQRAVSACRRIGVWAYRRTRNAEIVGEAARFASSRDRGKAGRFA